MSRPPAASQRPVSVAGGIQNDGAQFFNYAIVSNDSIVYEDDLLQIGYRLGTQGEAGRIVLYYGNLTNEKLNLTTALAADQMSVQPIGPLPAILEPKKQVQQQLNVTNVNDYLEPPLLRVTYGTANKNCQKVLKLPLTVNKFTQPAAISEAEFLKNWGEFANEKQYVVDTKAPANQSYVAQVLQEGFHLAYIQGSWNPQTNIVAAGEFVSQTRKHRILLRMELSATTPLYRITVRSSSPAIATAFANLLQIHFGAPAAI